jgi:CRISPR-associated endonuclease Csn1
MPEPWESKGLTGGTYREHVKRAVDRIWVSHKPDHGFEGAMHNDTAYALLGEGRVGVHKTIDGVRTYEEKPLKVIPFTSAKAHARHGLLADGSLRPYKGYLGGSIYCMEIVRNEKGRWESEIISTFQAYQIVKTSGPQRLRHSSLSMSGKPLVMRLLGGDALRLIVDDRLRTMRVVKMTSNGQIFMCELNEANVDARNTNKSDPFAYTSKYAGSLQKAQGRRVTISPIGEVRDLGFRP